jgi:hypothetical protein
MVAIIHNSSSLKNALHYNENKVRQKVAVFFHSANYLKDTEQLGFSDKISRLQRLAALNQQTKINCVHVSLNFDPSDKLNTEKLKQIADIYMQKIGFGEQPYLVYQHNDAGHPHLHIVTTNIQPDGKRLALHNLARNQSMKASKEIEQEFQLIQADKKHRLSYELKPVNAQKVQYGKAETKRAITNVLDHVLPTYKYASLAELNAVLKLYNIVADRGSQQSRTYQSKGLVYRVLNSNGEKVGVPIKASLIYNKPTLKNIEARFGKNENERQRHKQRITSLVDRSFLRRDNLPFPEFMKLLLRENIPVVLRQNDSGIIYGITYVDHHTKCVFNGSHLGKQYSANGIQMRCTTANTLHLAESRKPGLQIASGEIEKSQGSGTGLSEVFNDLMQPDTNQYSDVPYELKRFNRKRKKTQRQSLN